ncbi:MAG: efflux RND transporter periplasmic adaptor subunit [SAR324 cluster bacterium]|nr:efflux RND transporter periplasmic adaptor subunit [SAR324 cluster bacterium]
MKEYLTYFWIVLTILSVIVSGCESDKPTDEVTRDEKAQTVNNKEKEKQQRSSNVEIMQLTPQKFKIYKSFVGELFPNKRITLRSEREGTVESVSFEEGIHVEQNQDLVHISTHELELRVELAKSDLDLAKSNYERDQKLFEKKLVAPSQRDQMYHQFQTAKQLLQLSQLELAKSVLVSPLKGIVKSRHVEKGEFVNKGQMIAEILDMQQLKIMIYVQEQDIVFIKLNQKVDVSLYVQEKNFEGQITKLGIEADSTNRGFPIEISIPNVKGELRSGMLAKVNIMLNEYQNQLVIPRHTILERENGKAVFVFDNEKVVERKIKLGESHQEYVRIMEGLKFGDWLVVKGQHELSDKSLVNVRNLIQQPAL